VHDQPDFERHLEGARQDRDELGCAPGDGVLAAADAGAQRRELGEIAIAAKAAKTVGIPDAAERLAGLVLAERGTFRRARGSSNMTLPRQPDFSDRRRSYVVNETISSRPFVTSATRLATQERLEQVNQQSC
jgi:hypothetical protein